jgi:hypothetical protein
MATLDVGQGVAEPLSEGNGYATTSEADPLNRTFHVSIQASLNDFCLQRNRGLWAPTESALKNIFQQTKFTSLDGASESMGDLKAVVLHSLDVTHVKSSFPLALGAKITGVDDSSFSKTGEGFSTIILPNSESSRVRRLQKDDVSLAYEFAKKFPGYTADNLDSKGVNEVSQRRFVLLADNHPIVSAISENADKLQLGEISVMPEGLVKISSSLFNSIMPLVKTQVDSQIKVRDMSNTSVSVHPSEYSSWSEARNEIQVEAKRPMKAQLASALNSCTGGDDKKAEIRAKFDAQIRALEEEIDHTPLAVHMEIQMEYNFLGEDRMSSSS